MSEILILQDLVATRSAAVRVVTAGATITMSPNDYVLMIDKTVGSPTTVLLPLPTPGAQAVIKDLKGDSETNAITIDAGSGNLINGLQTLVLNANYSATWLIAASDSQWGTII